jgi:hypothetical protein
MRVCHLSENLKILLQWKSRTQFQQIVNNGVPLPGLLDWSYITALAYGPLRTRRDHSPRGLGQDCRVDSDVLSHSYASSPCTDEECVSAYYFVLHNHLSLFWTSVTQCRTKILESLKITSRCDGFRLWHKLDRYDSFSTPRDNSHGLMGWGCCLRLILLWRYFVTLFYALRFSFAIKVMKPASVSRHVAVKKVVAFDSILLMQLWRKFYFSLNLCPPSASKEPGGHRLSRMLNAPPSAPHCALLQSADISLTALRRFSLISSSIFPLFHSVEAVCEDH